MVRRKASGTFRSGMIRGSDCGKGSTLVSQSKPCHRLRDCRSSLTGRNSSWIRRDFECHLAASPSKRTINGRFCNRSQTAWPDIGSNFHENFMSGPEGTHACVHVCTNEVANKAQGCGEAFGIILRLCSRCFGLKRCDAVLTGPGPLCSDVSDIRPHKKRQS